ncbi:MAG: NUDIX domain-containing protein [Candidatus Aenigmatarchaeota archaeon]
MVKTLIRNDDGKFLAMKKSHLEKVSSGERFKKYGRMSGKWELPGGRIGKVLGESNRFEAARREVMEEAGIELLEGKDVVREEIEEVNDVNVYIVFYDKDQWRGEVETSEEHLDYNWVTPKEYVHILLWNFWRSV